MASVSKDSKGYRVRFVMPDGTQKTIRLAGFNKSKCEDVARHVEELISAKAVNGPPDRRTSNWLANIGQKVHDKLSAAGLVEPRASMRLSDFMAEYIADAKTADGKPAAPNTLKKWEQTRKVLDKFFGNRNLRDITHDDAVKFRRWLDETTLGENGKRTHIASAKMFFNAAKRRKLVEENAFEFQKASLVITRERDYFVTREMANRIIEAAPDTEWKLIIALWRFAGLRKMEIFHLRWDHILWDQGRMLVTCQKTAHHEGRGSRFVPTGEILHWLEKAFHEAPEGSQRVITRFTESNVNLAKPLLKIITAAGLNAWPKLIQNFRASCETEWLDAGHPAHVVARWIGHSVKVQNDHYAQVDDHHFDQFNTAATARKMATTMATPEKSDSVAIPVATKPSADKPTGAENESTAQAKPTVLRDVARGLGEVRKLSVPEVGVEQNEFLQGKQGVSETGGHSSGQTSPEVMEMRIMLAAELQYLIEKIQRHRASGYPTIRKIVAKLACIALDLDFER